MKFCKNYKRRAFVRCNEGEKRQLLVVKIGVQMLKQILKSRYEILILRLCAVKEKNCALINFEFLKMESRSFLTQCIRNVKNLV